MNIKARLNRLENDDRGSMAKCLVAADSVIAILPELAPERQDLARLIYENGGRLVEGVLANPDVF